MNSKHPPGDPMALDKIELIKWKGLEGYYRIPAGIVTAASPAVA
jgi:hypothetical protein